MNDDEDVNGSTLTKKKKENRKTRGQKKAENNKKSHQTNPFYVFVCFVEY